MLVIAAWHPAKGKEYRKAHTKGVHPQRGTLQAGCLEGLFAQGGTPEGRRVVISVYYTLYVGFRVLARFSLYLKSCLLGAAMIKRAYICKGCIVRCSTLVYR